MYLLKKWGTFVRSNACQNKLGKNFAKISIKLETDCF